MPTEQEVLDSLSHIIDPDLGKDIVSLGFVKKLTIKDGTVSFTLELTTPACPVKELFRKQATDAVKKLPGVESVQVELSAQKKAAAFANVGPGLQGVDRIIGVSSCKGGVGKSTVAVNLAFALAERGAKVGIFDADVYGPSLPSMVATDCNGLYQQDQLIMPVSHGGVAMMSFAWANPNPDAPAILRGPMVTQIIQQLLTQTNWGQLDYLVIDMPPGTGDIQLTLGQILQMTAAVTVTTPQKISFIDVIKGVHMFDKLKVPVIGVVENMSYFEIDGVKHEPFGRGAMHSLQREFGFPVALQLPMDPAVSACSDGGTPIVVKDPENPAAKLIGELADGVIREISKLEAVGAEAPTLTVDDAGALTVTGLPENGVPWRARDLRLACRCAHCVNEITGEQILREQDVPADVRAVKVGRLGRYAATVTWSDGHDSIYPWDILTADH